MSVQMVSSVRRVAVVLVLISLVLMIGALGALAVKKPHLHVDLIVFGFLPLFVGGVAFSYVVSGVRSSDKQAYLLFLSRVSGVLFLLVPLAAVMWGRYVGVLVLAISSVLMALFTALSAVSPRGPSVRLSLLSMASTYASTAVYSALLALRGDIHRPEIIGLLYALPVQAIYSVTIHSMPSTYGERADARLVAAMHGVVWLGLALLLVDARWGAAVLCLSPLLYFLAARVYRVPVRLRKVLDMGPGPVRSSHLYFLAGHIYAVASWVWLASSTILWLAGSVSLLAVIHALVMGFIGIHIYIHAPLMLPVLLGTSTERRYGHAPLLLLLASAMLWPVARGPAMLLFLLSLAALLLVVKVRGVPRSLLIPM